MAYQPLNVPEDSKDIPGFLRGELRRMMAATATPYLQLDVYHKAPDKPREGMIVCADGTDWDPGSGAGFYGFLGGAWVLLNTTSVWSIPGNQKSADYTLALTDQGVSIDTTAGVQVPTNAAVALPAGTTLLVTNLGASAIPITTAGDTLRLAGTEYAGDLVVPPYGVARLRKVAATSWYASEQAYPGERAVAWSDVLSRLTFDGADNGTSFPDANGTLVWTRYGNTVTKTGVKKFGTASGYFDGNGDYLQSGTDAALKNLLSQSFTFSCWVYPTTIKSRIFATGGGGTAWNATNGFQVLVLLAPNGAISVQFPNSAKTDGGGVSSVARVPVNAWAHIVVQVDQAAGLVGLGINGKMEFFGLPDIGIPSSTPMAAFGTIPGEAGNASFAFEGYIDDARLVIGVAQYRAPFYNVPAAALPVS